MPRFRASAPRESEIELWRAWKAGRSLRQLARSTGLSKSWVGRIVRAVDALIATSDPKLEYWNWHENEQAIGSPYFGQLQGQDQHPPSSGDAGLD